ncbi:hypothetical protein EW026_g4424 [Hermanssonia centrifuga]|uniref:Glycoside hydrolase family 5 domain-containing protein n=1 Tax=Hermanssonia centrifuga TaxID=98765 RepID=A0A4S4KH34_9APHY|nr:hypothetical protein EW026_g4424 [Hermanssonia centrifuga]
MQLTSGNLTALLQSLGLTQGLFKPIPGLSAQGQVASGNPHSLAVPIRVSSGDSAQTDNDPCYREPYYPAPLGEQTFPPFDQAKANVYRYRQQQSVNLGSWFVHEAWMTPSLFTCASGDQISELDIAYGWGSTTAARAVLERHWDTFIQNSDFQYLASIGINTVRLPIGYWSLGPDFCQGTPYANVADVYQNSWPRVLRTINMAEAAGIGVLVDLHGAPGSQNGQQHSGISDGNTGLFDDPAYINQTMAVLTFLTEQLADVSNVVGIQILNEPQNVPSLEDFYTTAINTMRQVSSEAARLPLYIHDGFDLERFSEYVAARTDFVVQDHHSYFVFTPSDDSEPASQHTSDIQNGIAATLASASNQQRRNLVVDEFSCALTDQSLQGESDPGETRREFCTGQMQVYANATAGWSFWAYRKEQCEDDPGWCFTAAVGNALPSTFFSYGIATTSQEPSQLPDMSALADGMSPPSMSAQSTAQSPYDSTPYPGYDSANPSVPPPFRRMIQSRQKLARTSDNLTKRDEDNTGAIQQTMTRGYSDGFLTAKIFALYGMSKLGFTGQYIVDSMAALGPDVVHPGMEGYYHDWFTTGLADGEATVGAGLTSF